MAIIPQRSLFSWREIDDLGDLQRLRLVIEHLPDESLMRALEAERGQGRDDYPVRAVWNSLLAMVVFQHESVESLRRELLRNAPLRDLCGFDPVRAASATPPSSAYSRFLRRLQRRGGEIEAIFDRLVDLVGEVLPEFGRTLAIDGKAIRTHAEPRKRGAPQPKSDGRRDTDADFGAKGPLRRTAGGAWTRGARGWFGYKLHLVVDADHELPVAFSVTRASVAEQPMARRLLGGLAARHGDLLERAETLLADKGYDDGKLIRRLWDDHRIRPVIAKRRDWRDQETRLVRGRRQVVYDQDGVVYCYPHKGEPKAMAFAGFESDRGTLKYRCPAAHYGLRCRSFGRCPIGGSIRIKLDDDRRIFTPVARTSYKWGRLYNQRGAVERVNSRLDVSYGFERHFIRGLSKMRLRVGLALSVMLAMALGRVKEKQRDKLRSLVAAA